MMQRLLVVGSALYVAAHPDDENTRLITWLARGRGLRTGYLSLTRGDGGQNLIGDEQGILLGVLRTQELLGARRIDGGEQLFTRAFDFGYSKSPEEALAIWGKNEVLADVVWVIRKFQPDVIITRFPGPEKGGGGHGHHTASAMLAQEAFRLAADPSAFPEQLRYVSIWQPRRLLWNAWPPGRFGGTASYSMDDALKFDIGGYDPLLGQSYGEIAAEARSMHRCQAFGVARQRGEIEEYLLPELGSKSKNDLFDGIDISWKRLEGGTQVAKWLQKALDAFDPLHPEASIPSLAKARQALSALESSPWKEQKLRELDEVMLYCAGIFLEANAAAPAAAQGDSIQISAQFISRSGYPARLERISFSAPGWEIPWGEALTAQLGSAQRKFRIEGLPPTQHYWLSQPVQGGLFQVPSQTLIGLPETPPALSAAFELEIEGQRLVWQSPVQYKYVDRSVGELYQPFVIAPRGTLNFASQAYLFPDEQSREIEIKVRAWAGGLQGHLYMEVPPGWSATPQSQEISLSRSGEEASVRIRVTPPRGATSGELRAWLESGGSRTSFQYASVAYDHIPDQRVWLPATARLVRAPVEKRGTRIGYLVGSGDEMPACLRQIGYEVDLLEENDISPEKLMQYDAVVAGIRAYNTRSRMPFLHEALMEYVRQGGVYLVQYNTTSDLSVPSPGPYPLRISRERVTVENAPVQMLKPGHQAFQFPNSITQADFDGWVQERGLYFPDQWDERYEALTACGDPGEKLQQGGLLVARAGKGYFIYSGYAWFRQLPAGVPGAYRLMANLLSIGKASPPQP
jgi:LmbE family N-acetylglucosaminyl deacetylase